MTSPQESRDTPSSPPSATPRRPTAPPRAAPNATALEDFDRSLKRRQQLALLVRLLGHLGEHRCLLISDGRSGGALNFHLRAAGGYWTWATTDRHVAAPAAALLGESVNVLSPDGLPFRAESFDRVVVHDLHPLLAHSPAFRQEIARVLVPGGITVWTAPNGNPRLPVNLLRGRPERGLSIRELDALAARAGLVPTTRGSCSRFFSEFLEWSGVRPGSPVRSLAVLDHLIPGARGYELALAARKASTNGLGHPGTPP